MIIEFKWDTFVSQSEPSISVEEFFLKKLIPDFPSQFISFNRLTGQCYKSFLGETLPTSLLKLRNCIKFDQGT